MLAFVHYTLLLGNMTQWSCMLNSVVQQQTWPVTLDSTYHWTMRFSFKLCWHSLGFHIQLTMVQYFPRVDNGQGKHDTKSCYFVNILYILPGKTIPKVVSPSPQQNLQDNTLHIFHNIPIILSVKFTGCLNQQQETRSREHWFIRGIDAPWFSGELCQVWKSIRTRGGCRTKALCSWAVIRSGLNHVA